MVRLLLIASSIALAWTGWARRGRGSAYACTLVATACFVAAVLLGPTAPGESSPEPAPCEAQSADTGAKAS